MTRPVTQFVGGAPADQIVQLAGEEPLAIDVRSGPLANLRIFDFFAEKSTALMGPQPCVKPTCGEQRVVSALLHDAASGTSHGPVRNTYRRSHRWSRILRHEDDLAVLAREENEAALPALRNLLTAMNEGGR